MVTMIVKQEIANVANMLAHEEEMHSPTDFCQKIWLIHFVAAYTYKKQTFKKNTTKLMEQKILL